MINRITFARFQEERKVNHPLLMGNPIRNIIFDLGGVLLNVDICLTEQAFIKLGIKNIRQWYLKLEQNNVFTEFEKGTIKPAAFRKILRQHLPGNPSDKTIDLAWNAMLLDLPAKRMKLLRKLKSNYRLFLLSNTNIIHIRAFSEYLKSTYGIKNLPQIFEKVYYSFKTGIRKPDAEAYRIILEENNLKPEETLFADDSPQNVEGARLVGLNAILVKAGSNLEEII